jgi:hypothetical protein
MYQRVSVPAAAAAAAFYDKLLAVLGSGWVLVQPNRAVNYGYMALDLGVIKPFNGKRATVGNGNMVATEARSRAQVREVHAAAPGEWRF